MKGGWHTILFNLWKMAMSMTPGTNFLALPARGSLSGPYEDLETKKNKVPGTKHARKVTNNLTEDH